MANRLDAAASPCLLGPALCDSRSPPLTSPLATLGSEGEREVGLLLNLCAA